MARLRDMTIKKRVIWVIMLVSLVAVVIGSLVSMVVSARYEQGSLEGDLRGLSEMIADNCLVSLAYKIPEDAQKLLASLKRRPSIKYAVIQDVQGNDFAVYHSPLCNVAEHHLPPRADAVSETYGSSSDGRFMHVWQTVVFDGKQIGSLHLFDDMTNIRESFRRDIIILSVVMVVVMCVAYGMTMGLHSLISNPLGYLTGVARKISMGGDYGIRAERKTGGEIGVLVDSFNDMLDQIEGAKFELEAVVQELESKNMELERFTYTVSHDLKSPLITIKGFVGQLRKHRKQGMEERVEKDVQRIEDAADKMSDLLRDLLELSRIGRVAGEEKTVPFNDIVTGALSLLEGPIDESKVDVRVEEDMPKVTVDSIRFSEALQNLIENAIKFMDVQEKPRIEIGCRKAGPENIFYVSDNGMGIEEQYREKVFGLFEQLNQHIPGTGIGLTIVRRIVEIHGGSIWVEEGLDGCGASFCFTVNTADENQEKKNAG